MSKLFSPWTIVAVLVMAALFLMLGPARGDSAIMDELAHIPAGYSYVKYLDYRLNPEHPPLVKILAGLPLLFKDLKFPTDQTSWTTDINGQWTAGTQFLYESGNNADEIIFLARLGPIILTLLLIIFVYVFAKELLGRWWALLPTTFTALSPNILAHGHYVATDIGATLGILLAIYFFLKYLFQPTAKHLVLAGLAFGVAQLMKFSAVLLGPYFLVIVIIFCLAKLNVLKPTFLKYLLATFAIFIIGALLIYAFYLLATWNYPPEKQLSDTEYTLQSFNFRPLADLDIWMVKNPILRPMAEYVLGVLMVGRRTAGGNTAYFLGELSAVGWRYYFPMVFLMKEPAGILITIALAFLLGFWAVLKSFKNGLAGAFRKFKEYLNTSFAELALIVFVVIYWSQSMSSNLNIGFRHLIPTLPMIYILSASAIKKWLAVIPSPIAAGFMERLFKIIHYLINTGVKSAALSLLILWFIVGSLLSYPYFLSYFNEFFGGVFGGYQYATDSNFDWGQDLKRLKIWTDLNLEPGEKIAVDYFGGGNPKYYLGDRVKYWQSRGGSPKDEGINWLAVSANTIQGAVAKTAPGFARNPADEYLWLKNPLPPTDRVGTSIFLYRL